MKILVVGSGGREHALVWSLSKSANHSLICAPGNPGIAEIAKLFQVEASDIDGLVSLAAEEEVDLVVAGPEVPLVAGLADELRKEGIPCFGPGADGAQLEGSKWFAKEIMESARVPTARAEVFTDMISAMEYIGVDAFKYVIKADGLAAGKGVFLPDNSVEASDILEEIFAGKFGKSGNQVLIEERLEGREVSVLAICSGGKCVILPPSRDHKRLGDHDKGPNTGGMGAVCPPPGTGDCTGDHARDRIILPVLAELASRGIDYRGVLYAGLMITEEGPKVLEFNVRFGDPETQAVLPLIHDDLGELFLSAATGGTLPEHLTVEDGFCSCVVMASGGYPGTYEKGFPITGLDTIENAVVFQAGTAMDDETIVTGGGRVLCVASIGDTIEESLDRTYRELEKIDFKGKYYRKDIGRTI
ncbi:MAG: phosphoribosylamine--glycine ligase [Candidatus Fermentibacteria bacterium]